MSSLLQISQFLCSPVKSTNFTRGHVTTSLGHEPHPSLRIRSLEGVDVVDEGGLRSNLEVSDDTVSLSTEIHKVSVRVVDGEHNPVRCVQLHHHDGVVQMARSSQAVLPFAVLGEAGGEDQPILEVDCPRSLRSFMSNSFLLHSSISRINLRYSNINICACLFKVLAVFA